MTDPFNLFTSALEQFVKVRYFGSDRGRCACPVCGGKNQSTFSFERKPDGGVRFHCFKDECDIHAVTSKLGIEPSDLFPPRLDGYATPRPKRIGMLSAGQAIELIRSETGVLFVTVANLKGGVAITEDDIDRAVAATSRIEALCKEYAS